MFLLGIEIILFFIAVYRVSCSKTIIKMVYLSWISDCEQRNIYLFFLSRSLKLLMPQHSLNQLKVLSLLTFYLCVSGLDLYRADPLLLGLSLAEGSGSF